MGRIFYSSKAKGFYHEGINKNIPEDAVEITADQLKKLMDSEAVGYTIASDAHGKPVAIPPSDTTIESKRQDYVTRIKTEAAARIEAVAPIWKQLNAIRGEGEVDFDKIDQIRAAATKLEEQVAKMDDYKLAMFNPKDDLHWVS